MKVIINAELVEHQQSAMTESGWLVGSGIFETIKTIGAKPWAFSRHMRRAVSAARREQIPMPEEEVVRNAVSILLAAESHQSGVLRISFSKSGDWGAAHLPYSENSRAARIETYPEIVAASGVMFKSFPYDHRLNILEKSRSRGFDEALLINSNGKVCEGAVTNVVLKIAGIWVTPPLSDGVLPGIMRALVIENTEVTVRSIAAAEIEKVEAAFLLSSLRIAQPVASIDGRELVQSHDFKEQIEALALRTSVG